MKLKFPVLILLTTLLLSCKAQVLMRFKNESSEDIKKLKVNVLGKKFEFENLRSGKSTEFIKVDSSYSYCALKVLTEKDSLYLIPIDYEGEKIYKSGKLNLTINIVENKDKKREIELKAKR